MIYSLTYIDEAIAWELQLLENDIENYYQSDASEGWIVHQGINRSNSSNFFEKSSTVARSENFEDIVSEQLALKINNEDQARIIFAAEMESLFLKTKYY